MSTAQIAKYYSKWINSKPLDCGQSEKNALTHLMKGREPKFAKNAAAQNNKGLHDNAALKRITPLAVWLS